MVAAALTGAPVRREEFPVHLRIGSTTAPPRTTGVVSRRRPRPIDPGCPRAGAG
jgi:hypothetical protein